MANVNSLQSNIPARNTGIGSSFFDPALIRGMIIVPKGYKITAADALVLQTKLTADTQLDSKLSRIYPVSGFVDFKDGSEKKVEQSFGYGGKVTVRDGAYTWSFQFNKGGHTLLQALRAFNGSNWDFLFVDDKNQLMGQIYADAVNGNGVKAIPSIELYAEPFALNDGKKIAEYMLDVSFFANYVNENLAFISDADFEILDTIEGLVDVNLSGAAHATSGKYTIVAKDNLKVNLYGELGAGLAVLGAWKAVNTQTGLIIPVLSAPQNAAADSGNGGWDVTLDKTSPNYPAGVTDKVTITLVGPTALAVANVGGYEAANKVSIVKN